jgi:hypothetical protein
MRTSLLTLSLVALLATGARSTPALARDIGPSAAVAAIRHDLPLLLASQLGSEGSKLVVDWVVVDRDNAVAEWNMAGNRGVVVLRFRAGRWWWRAAAVTASDSSGSWTAMQTPGGDVSPCGANYPGPPSAHDLLVQGLIGDRLAITLSDRLRPTSSKVSAFHECMPDARYIEDTGVSYDAALFDKERIPERPALKGYVPDEQQRPGMPAGKVYYAFTLSASDSPVLFRTDSTTFRIWFPYVLSQQVRYTLNIRNVYPEVLAIPGGLKANVLHFALPSFTLPAHATAEGEIEGIAAADRRSGRDAAKRAAPQRTPSARGN